MSKVITNGIELEFTLTTLSKPAQQPEVDARTLCAGLLALSRVNAFNHKAVKIMIEETFQIDPLLSCAPAPEPTPPE